MFSWFAAIINMSPTTPSKPVKHLHLQPANQLSNTEWNNGLMGSVRGDIWASLLAHSPSRCLLHMMDVFAQQEFTMWINNIHKLTISFPLIWEIQILWNEDKSQINNESTSIQSGNKKNKNKITLTSKLLNLMLSGSPGWFGAAVVILTDADVLTEALRGLSSFLLPHGLQPITEGPSEWANHRGPFWMSQSESRTAPTLCTIKHSCSG